MLQASLATCGANCNLQGLHKTQTALDAFSKKLDEFSQTLSSDQRILLLQKQYREQHKGNIQEVVVAQKTR